VGLLLISLLFALTDKMLVEYFSFADIFYRLLLPLLMVPASFMYLYGWLTPHKGSVWGTR
ncbi:MAG: hypothetical protein LBC03_02060, partial [Nitrososphaerota archaeon]|nr:hypothetical protein [Nitrososphaerota archaeon]